MTVNYNHTILLVDDEVSIVKSLNRLLKKQGYNIITANSGSEGLEILKNPELRVSGIISDQRMPGLTGAQFLQKAKKLAPEAFRILLTGHADIASIIEAVNKGEIQKYLTKPWNDDDLLAQIRQSLEQYELTLENKRLNNVIKRQNKQLKEINKDLEAKVEERSAQIKEKNKALEESLFNTVRAFASIIDYSSQAVAGHGRRVSFMSKELGKIFQLSETRITYLEIAALLHDIGKVGFPEKLFTVSTSKMTQEEKELYYKHPEEGQQIIKFINKLDYAGKIIRSHHERYDGLGRPDNLKADDIPIESQIISVADRYDKIANLKIDADTYIKEYAKENDILYDHVSTDSHLEAAAVFHIKRRAFTEFSPDIVKAFLNFVKKQGISDGKDKEIPIEQLDEGMIISRSLYTKNGRFVLPHNTKLNKDLIAKLKALSSSYSVIDKVYVLT